MPTRHGSMRHAMSTRLKGLTAAIVLTITSGTPLAAAESNDILSQIERMASLGDKADPSLGEAIANGIEGNQAVISKALALKLTDNSLSDPQLAVYVWVLGLTKDLGNVGGIVTLYKQSKSDGVRANCLRALASIGDPQAGQFLMSALDETKDRDIRFEILNLLGQMQHAAALPKTGEILKQDPEDASWQAILVFGKMGDKAVPFLMERINDSDINVRTNAISILGQWLIAPEAAKPLYDQFRVETQTVLRCVILASLHLIIADPAQLTTIFQQVLAKEKEENVVKLTQQLLDNIGELKATMAVCARERNPSATDFAREYTQLMKSSGKKGNYDALGISSTLQDEPKLKTLREYILRRDSDEAFDDYQKVNAIIMQNRIVGKTTKANADKP